MVRMALNRFIGHWVQAELLCGVIVVWCGEEALSDHPFWILSTRSFLKHFNPAHSLVSKVLMRERAVEKTVPVGDGQQWQTHQCSWEPELATHRQPRHRAEGSLSLDINMTFYLMVFIRMVLFFQGSPAWENSSIVHYRNFPKQPWKYVYILRFKQSYRSKFSPHSSHFSLILSMLGSFQSLLFHYMIKINSYVN